MHKINLTSGSPNVITGTSDAPVLMATLTNPFLLLASTLYWPGFDLKASSAPPATKPTAFPVSLSLLMIKFSSPGMPPKRIGSFGVYFRVCTLKTWKMLEKMTSH